MSFTEKLNCVLIAAALFVFVCTFVGVVYTFYSNTIY